MPGRAGSDATYSVKDEPTKAPFESESTGGESAKRRRTGRVVHDDRGCASVEWQDAPANQPRTVLQLEDAARAQRRLRSHADNPATKAPRQDTFNPYQRAAGETAAAGPRRDLRKLSKWIKTMREVEERKALDAAAAKKPADE
jgi:hypothetical protein